MSLKQLTGIAVLTVGAVIFTAYNHYHNFLGNLQISNCSHSFYYCGQMSNEIDSIKSFILGDELWSAPAILMAIGAIVFIIAFLGCCGAIKENSCMVLTVSFFNMLHFITERNIEFRTPFAYKTKANLITFDHFYIQIQFSLLLIVIILFEIGIGAFGYANKEELNTALDKGFNKTLHNYEPNREAWDMVQSEVWNYHWPCY